MSTKGQRQIHFLVDVPLPFVSEHLKRKQIDELAALMDARDVSSIGYWEYIAEIIYKENKDRKQIIDDLRRSITGGGNPGLKFLEILEVMKGDLTVAQFCTTAESKDINRHDIAKADFLKNAQPSGGLMCNLEPQIRLKLATKLVPGSGIADWEYFADEYDFPYSTKEEIKQVIKSEGKHSPAIGLIEKLIKDEWTIERLEGVCKQVTGLGQIRSRLAKLKV